MYIYNVTVNVAEGIEEEWMHWLRQTHIPDMMSTGKFLGARVCRVDVEEAMGGTTFAVQYFTNSREELQRYYAEDADRMRQDGANRFGDKCLYFRTELEILSEHQ